MDDLDRSSSDRFRRGRLSRAALVLAVAITALLAVPGTASAAGEVTPLFDCVIKHQGGAGWTAVLGYSNSSSAPVTYAVGPDNVLRPAARDGEQPTTFEPGTHRGAFSVAFHTGNSVTWTVAGRSVSATMNDKSCPSATELPEEGNGTGPAIALAVAGVVGAVALHRARRRAITAGAATGEDGDRA